MILLFKEKKMSRTLALIVILAFILLGWFGISHYQKTYEMLPANLPKKLEVPETKSWVDFTPRSDKFSVSLPVTPQHATENQGDRNYDMYASEKENGTLFMISLISFKNPIKANHHEVVLNSIMEDLLNTNPANKLKSSASTTFENKKALDFTIENKEIIIVGKAFMDEQTLYVLTYIAKLNNLDKDEVDKFMHTFHLLPLKNQKIGVKSE